MVGRRYTPERGDIIWLSFSPQSGREQAGRRPALVLSPAIYNRRSGLAVVCPITSRAKGYPFEVGLGGEAELRGVILADQVRSLDWRRRGAELAARATPNALEEVAAKVRAPLGL